MAELPYECDLVLKGGITSGIVYPSAIAEISTDHRFRSVGGSSAGAIAAVAKPVVTKVQNAFEAGDRIDTLYDPDTRGRIIGMTDPNGNDSSVTLDSLHGQATVQTMPTGWTSTTGYDLWRRPDSQTDINGRTTTTDYDEYGRVIAVRAPVDSASNLDTVKITYNEAASPAYVTTERRLTGTTYSKAVSFVDGFGRPIFDRTYAPEANKNWVTATQYDDVGRAYRSSGQYSLPNDLITTFDYPNWDDVPSFTQQAFDSLGRVILTETRDGTGGPTSGDIALSSSMSYPDRFTTIATDPKGQDTKTTIDGLGRTEEVHEVTAGSVKTSYTYNAADDLLTVRAPQDTATNHTVIDYDLLGRKTSMRDPDTSGPNKSWTYTYDDNSNVKTQTDPSGTTLRYLYDSLNRPTYTQRHNGGNSYTNLTRVRYDANAELGSIWDTWDYTATFGSPYDVQRYWYDTYGRVRYTRTFSSNPNGNGYWSFTKQYTHRPDGQIATTWNPTTATGGSGAQVAHGYNARTGLADDLTKFDNTVIVDDVTWNHAGQVLAREYGASSANGAASFYYDPATTRLIADAAGTSPTTSNWRLNYYYYDDNSNITEIREVRNSNQWQCFTYDALDRLKTAYTDNTSACNGQTDIGAGNYDETYTYNLAGNIKTRTQDGVTATYKYQDNDHKHAVTTIQGVAGGNYTYDDNGDATQRTAPGTTSSQALTWDEQRRLRSVTEGAAVTSFRYDSDGTRVRRQSGNDYTYYFPGGEYLYNTGTSTGEFTYYHALNDSTVAMTIGGELTWMYGDQIGSTSLTRTAAGANKTQRYLPFGEIRTDGNLTNDRQYTGQINDQTTGLYHYNARYYDPTIGRFVSPDTIVPDAGDSQDYNRYTYVRNNPIKYNDPTGHQSNVCPPDDYGCFGITYDDGTYSFYDHKAQAKREQDYHSYVKCNPGTGMYSCDGAMDGLTSSERLMLTVRAYYPIDTVNCAQGEGNARSASCTVQRLFLVISVLAGMGAPAGLLDDAPGTLGDDILRRADANLTGSGETVLGHFGDDYIGLAQQRGASYFDIGDAWAGLSDAQRWAANRRVLDTAISNGDRITLATNRTKIRPGSALAAEIEYLTGPAGAYQWLDDVTLIPGG